MKWFFLIFSLIFCTVVHAESKVLNVYDSSDFYQLILSNNLKKNPESPSTTPNSTIMKLCIPNKTQQTQ